MTKQEIIAKLYTDKDINNAIRKMHPVELQEDLKQEMFMVLCEMNDERVKGMVDNNYIKPFLLATMKNMIMSDRSTFFKKFRRQFTEYCEAFDRPDEKSNEELSPVLNRAMKELHWYEEGLFTMYAQNGGNVQQVSNDTGIPYRSLIKTVTKVRRTLKATLNNKDGSQLKLVGNYIDAEMKLRLDVTVNTNIDELVDILDQASEFIREKIEGIKNGDVTIKKVEPLKIKKVI